MRPLRLYGPAFLIYAGLAMASTWPMAADLHSLPLGSEAAGTVGLAMAWGLWWNCDRLFAGLSGFWKAPIFFPSADSFAFSEPLIGEGVLSAPLIGLGASPMWAHNVVLLLALVTNGLIGLWVARGLRLSKWAAVAAGAIMMMLPFVHREIGVMPLVPLGGLLWTIAAVVRFARRPSWRRSAVVGVAWAVTYLFCGQYGLLIVLVMLPTLPVWVARRRLRFDRWGAAGVALLVGSLLVSPVVTAQLAASRDNGFERSVEASTLGAAEIGSWWVAAWEPLVPAPFVVTRSKLRQQALFMGTVSMGLAACGFFWGRNRRLRARTTCFLAALAVSGFLISMLPRLVWGPLVPYEWLREVVPGLKQTRIIMRAGVLTHIAVALLAAQGLHALLARARALARAEQRRAFYAGAAALGVLATVEIWPSPMRMMPVPDLASWHPWTVWVEANTSEWDAFVYLPMSQRGPVQTFEEDARWMYLSTGHRRPMLNGYSSFVPEQFPRISRIWKTGDWRKLAADLEELGIRHAVIKPSWLRQHPKRVPLPEDLWERAYENLTLDVAVYRRR